MHTCVLRASEGCCVLTVECCYMFRTMVRSLRTHTSLSYWVSTVHVTLSLVCVTLSY